MNVAGMLLSGMWLQGELDSHAGLTWLIVFVGLLALAMVTQAIVVIVIAVGTVKARKRVLAIAEDLHGKVSPLIAVTHDMVRDASPKVKVITENLAHTSHLVRSKATEFDATMNDANAKTRAQVARVDGMVTSVLDTTSDIAHTLQRAARVPAREFAGLMNGLKAGLDVLLGRKKNATHVAEEHEPVGRF